MPIAKVWNGSAWVTPFFKYPQMWDGTQWSYARPRIYNGTTWGGTASQTVTVTVGAYVIGIQYVGTDYYYGLYSETGDGAITPQYAYIVDTSPKFVNLYWHQFAPISGTSTYDITLSVIGEDTLKSVDIGKWTNMNINGYNYAKSAATITEAGNGLTLTWTVDATNPFGTTEGTNVSVVFS